MPSISGSKLLATALCAILSFTDLSPVAAAPMPQASATAAALAASSSTTSGYWLGQTGFHANKPVFGNTDAGYPLFRNVMDYGAKGDGVTDDTDAINIAINTTVGPSVAGSSTGSRCGVGCNSSTTSLALVYFPGGKTYLVSSPIIMDYYTQIVGDPTDLPTIVASPQFAGIAILDADPYGAYGVSWYINQNNFFRQVRNFIIDVRPWSNGMAGAGIHWQVAQATSLQNIRFEMSTTPGTKQQGIFMDNGSGGFMGDLVFNGGEYGAFLGNQQFTSRNMTFNGCQTGVYMNWNWGWTLADMTFNQCGTGIDMSNSPTNQTVGSVVVADSTFTGTQYGIRNARSTSKNVPETGGTLVIDNCDMTGASVAVVDANNATVLAGGSTVKSWATGNVYDHTASATTTRGTITVPSKPSSLLSNGKIFGMSKPQYETEPASNFLRSISDGGCKGDGVSDDTVCIQNFLNNASNASKIAYIDHGVYLISKTINVPVKIDVVGECWSTFLITGFNTGNPTPVFQVGTPGQSGQVKISDILFEIRGPQSQAIVLEWNINSAQGESGLWDTHIRIGGSYGSELLLANCAKEVQNNSVNSNCLGVFLMFYASPQSGGVYLENTWFWVADHDMEDALNQQVSIYSGRGTLIKSSGAVWLWGTSSEHSIFYNYQFDGVQALWAGFMQSETPYFQPYPLAPKPFSVNTAYDDPDFTICSGSSLNEPCQDAWGLRVVQSKNVFIYSGGFYSFFNGYTQECVAGNEENCQLNMVRIQQSQATIYSMTTKATVNMIRDDPTSGSQITITGAENRDVYGDTIALYLTS